MTRLGSSRRGRSAGGSRAGRWAALALVPLAGVGALSLVPGEGEAQSARPEAASAGAGSVSKGQAGASQGVGARDPERALFPVCAGAVRVTCVVDGDTIWYRGTKIRIADIDTPEVSQPACPEERALGQRATARLRELLNAGAFALEVPPGGRDTDRYGRALRIVTRGGESLGTVLVREGLASRWGGRKRAWCGG